MTQTLYKTLHNVGALKHVELLHEIGSEEDCMSWDGPKVKWNCVYQSHKTLHDM